MSVESSLLGARLTSESLNPSFQDTLTHLGMVSATVDLLL